MENTQKNAFKFDTVEIHSCNGLYGVRPSVRTCDDRKKAEKQIKEGKKPTQKELCSTVFDGSQTCSRKPGKGMEYQKKKMMSGFCYKFVGNLNKFYERLSF